jgi:DNA-binding beta-propeller fold protein YncE
MRFSIYLSIGLFFMLLAGVVRSQAPADLSGTLIVLNKSGNDATFIDLESGDVVATLPTGNNPHELVVTDDGRWAIGTDYSVGNSLTVFDVENLSVARTIDLSEHPMPHGILLMPGQESVIVTTEGSNEVLIIDFHAGRIEEVIETGQPGSHMVAMSSDGSLAVTANTRGNSASVIDLEAGETVRILDMPPQPEAIGANPAQFDVWVGSNSEGTVSLIDLDDGDILRQLSGFSWPYRILFTRDQRYVVIPDPRGQVMRVFDAASGEEHGSLEFPGGAPQGVTLHPDDRTLFLSLSGDDRVAVVDIERMRVLAEYEVGNGPDGIGYSPLIR